MMIIIWWVKYKTEERDKNNFNKGANIVLFRAKQIIDL